MPYNQEPFSKKFKISTYHHILKRKKNLTMLVIKRWFLNLVPSWPKGLHRTTLLICVNILQLWWCAILYPEICLWHRWIRNTKYKIKKQDLLEFLVLHHIFWDPKTETILKSNYLAYPRHSVPLLVDLQDIICFLMANTQVSLCSTLKDKRN